MAHRGEKLREKEKEREVKLLENLVAIVYSNLAYQ